MAEKVYQAVVGIDFEGLKPPVRVEPGAALPNKVNVADIKWLLEQGLIREITLNQESEGDK